MSDAATGPKYPAIRLPIVGSHRLTLLNWAQFVVSKDLTRFEFAMFMEDASEAKTWDELRSVCKLWFTLI